MGREGRKRVREGKKVGREEFWGWEGGGGCFLGWEGSEVGRGRGVFWGGEGDEGVMFFDVGREWVGSLM